MESIFIYTNYRQYLRSFFSHKKAEKAGYSLQVFADKAGFKARDHILRVMNGARNLSQSGALMLSKAMRLSEKETDFFINLVGFNQAKSAAEKEHYFNKLSSIRPYGKEQRIRTDQYEYFSEWYHAAIRSLLPVMDVGDDARKLAQMLDPAISISQAKKSIELLLRLGFIVRDGKESYRVSNPSLDTGEEVKSHALIQFHKKCLQLASRALDVCPAEDRDISGVTMSVSASAIARIKEEIRAFRNKVAVIARNDTNEDRACQLSIQFFPLSRKRALS
jgi:uncharacterized protein (TIGR02147 family)